jgi:RNA polymerase sigma factor (sigma-70 family)
MDSKQRADDNRRISRIIRQLRVVRGQCLRAEAAFLETSTDENAITVAEVRQKEDRLRSEAVLEVEQVYFSLIAAIVQRHEFPTRDDYDEFVVDMKIELIDAVETFIPSPFCRFDTYIRKIIRNRCNGFLRVVYRQASKSKAVDRFATSQAEQEIDRDKGGQVVDDILLEEIWHTLGTRERDYLHYYAYVNLTITEIATRFRISRTSVTRLRCRIERWVRANGFTNTDDLGRALARQLMDHDPDAPERENVQCTNYQSGATRSQEQ